MYLTAPSDRTNGAADLVLQRCPLPSAYFSANPGEGPFVFDYTGDDLKGAMRRWIECAVAKFGRRVVLSRDDHVTVVVDVPDHADVFEYLMLCRMLVDSRSGVEPVYQQVLKAMASVQEKARAYADTMIKDEFIRQTYQTALLESDMKMNSTTLNEASRKPLTERAGPWNNRR